MMTKQTNIHRAAQQGVALVITLWVIVVLSTVSLAYLRQINLELKMVGFQRDAAVVDSIAKAGLQEALIQLREDRLKDSGEEIKPTVVRFSEQDTYDYDGGNENWAHSDLYDDVPFYENGDKTGYYYVTVHDEASKFPINNPKISLDMIAHMLELTGVDEKKAKQLAGAVMDWKDADSIPTDTGEGGFSRDGADETSYYNTGRRSRKEDVPMVVMKNAPIDGIDEFLLIPGFTPDIVYGTVDPAEYEGGGRFRHKRLRRGEYLGLQNYMTTYSDVVNLNTVKQEVLEALLYQPLGEDAENVASEWVEYRNGRDKQLYTDDDQVLKTIDNSDLDDVHYTEVQGMTEELVTQFGAGLFSIKSRNFEVICLADYEGIEKGYRAIVERDFIPWNQLPVLGLDTDRIEDLEQVILQVRIFEPINDAEDRINRLM
ncbi:MAG: hypothetical protein GC154_10135 [bacterium]|nr:hypothetical protein [bacterium]